MRRDVVAMQMMYSRVGDAIRQLRIDEGLTIREFAERVGITLNHMQKIESAQTACSLYVLVRIADEFDTTLDALVPVAIDEKEMVA